MSNKHPKLLVSVKNRKISTDEKFIYPLTKHFLYLYFYLALKRKEDPFNIGGFVGPEEILLLPHWERNDNISVGKQLRRHILKMEKIGRNIIEAQQKINGPFRIILPPEQIDIDVPIETIMNVLDLRHISKMEIKQESKFYEFIENMCDGNASFDNGILKDALSSFTQANKSAINSKQKVAALQKIGWTFERLGDIKNTRSICEKILKLNNLDEIEMSLTYFLLAWIKWREGHLDEAEEIYYKGLDILRGKKQYRIMGSIFNGLGLIRKERKQYQEALSFYQRALEYWSLVDYFLGIQAAYFNIGNIYKILGDKVSPKYKDSKMAHYQTGIKWVKKCALLCQKMGIAYETSQDHILLAALYRRTGDLKQALEYAKTATDMALTAGNKRDTAYSYRILGKVYISTGEKDLAKSAFQSYISYLKKLRISKKELRAKEEEVDNFLAD